MPNPNPNTNPNPKPNPNPKLIPKPKPNPTTNVALIYFPNPKPKRNTKPTPTLTLTLTQTLTLSLPLPLILPPFSSLHLLSHATVLDLVCRLLLEKKKDSSKHLPGDESGANDGRRLLLEKEKEKFFKFSAAPFRKIPDRIFLPFHIFARLAGMGRKLQDTCTGLMV